MDPALLSSDDSDDESDDAGDRGRPHSQAQAKGVPVRQPQRPSSPGARAAAAAVALSERISSGCGVVLTRLIGSLVPPKHNRAPQCVSLRDVLELPGTLTSSVHFNYVRVWPWLAREQAQSKAGRRLTPPPGFCLYR